MTHRDIVISVKDIWKSFNNHEVLRGLNLDVFHGEMLVILGPSGIGKSVLLKHLLGLLTPDSGTIEVEGESLFALSEENLYRVLRKMGMLFQGSALFDSMNIGANTAFYLEEHHALGDGTPVHRSEIPDRVEEALRAVGLSGTQKSMPSDLSGGMRKRAALARLLAYRPLITLYDEPTTGLDPITAEQINDLLVEVQQRLHATGIVVTHDIRSAWKIGDRFALLSEGRITHLGSPEEFLKLQDPFIDFLRTQVLGALPPRRGHP